MFFNKKESKVIPPEVVMSRDTLMKSFSSILEKLAEYKNDECMKDVREILQIGKNVAILDSAFSGSESDRVRFQAKIEMYNELQTHIEAAVSRTKTELKNGKGPVRGTLRTVRPQNLAGSTI